MTEFDPAALDLLVCPRCRGNLRFVVDPESLDCRACALRFRVEQGVPVLLLSKAEPISRAGARR